MTSDLNNQIDNLSSEQLELLKLLLAEEGVNLSEAVILPQSRKSSAFPLSFAQQRMWFLNQIEPQSAAYHIPTAYRLTGKLDIPALEQSLRAVVLRHAALRTVFKTIEGVPQQVILQEPDMSLPVVDLTHLPQSEQEAVALDWITAEWEKPFDLARDLMIRSTVLRLDAQDHILSVVMHHIASDGWSMRIFWRELAEAYAAYVCGKTPSYEPLPIEYADYAIWQREWLQGGRLEQQLDYWRQELADLSPLQLPTDFIRPDTITHRGAGEQFRLESELVERLRKLAREEGTTLHTVLLAVYAVLLSRTAIQDDIAVGTPIAGRVRTELEPLIGFFVNTLVIRARLGDNPSFRALLQQMRQTTIAAYDHQDIPFEKLVEELEPERHLNRNPLISTVFQLIDLPLAGPDFPGLAAEAAARPDLQAKFDIACSLFAGPNGLSGRWRYAADLFRAETIQRMIGHYQTLLAAVVEDPDCAVGQLPILTEAELRRQLVEWNDTAVAYPRDSTIHTLFEAQALSTPQATAVFFEGQTLTYAELNQRANQLAHFLIEQGIRSGEMIGLAFERSLELVVTMLAILKTGAAYLPLDSNYPRERINWMLDDAKCRFIISSNSLRDLLPGDGIQLICLDDENEAAVVSRQSTDNLNTSGEISSTSLAYVMFTSGSTGRPKGVMVSHRAVVRLVKNTNYADLGPDQRILQFAPVSFDAATLEIWGPLLNGGQLFIYPPGPASLVELADYLREREITTLWLTAGLFHQMVDHEVETLANVSQVLSGGDVISPRYVRRLLQVGGICRFSNGYGPTENTTFTTYFSPSKVDDVKENVLIGRPISNSTVYILDANMQPVPIGVPGELCAGGDGLALGYLNRPELTRAAFIPNPFSSDGQSRLYRTGDRARYLPDGSIEFMGRLDRQVKIRGYRIEPGEVEIHLERHEAVQQAVVIVRENEAGDKILLAYAVPVSGRNPEANELKRFMSRKLPDYMIPSTVTFLKSFPLNANGKVDRQALPVPEGAREAPAGEYVAPRDDIERALSAIWAELLDQDRVGIHDNFFELGGHSLLSVRLFSRIEENFGRRLPLSVLYSSPTVAQLSEQLEQPGSAMHSRTLVPIQIGGNRVPFFCVHGFGGSVLGYADLAMSLGNDRPFYGLQAKGLEDDGPADTSIEAMAARYVEAMREVQPFGPYRIGGYCFGGVVAFEMARQLEADGESAALVAIMEGYAPIRYQRQSSLFSIQRWRTVWQNIPYWLQDYWELGIDGVRLRIERKVGLWRKRLLRRIGVGVIIDAQDVLQDELSALPDYHRQLLEIHLRALRDYAPMPLHGGITLFAAKGKTISKAMFGSTDAEHGWGSLAYGGVEVKLVDGGHRNIQLQPNVSSLAATLAEKLRAVDASGLH